MGAWGYKSFENDDALDFVWNVEQSGMDAIQHALQMATGPSDVYLEAPEACAALAAAEFVAAKKTGNTDRLPEESAELLKKVKASPDVTADAKKAVSRVLQNSELRELWEEGKDGDDFNIWHDDVLVLLERLQ